ncbi:hypothetical protein [Gilvimarinus xylanilyticus]|nr:hypothetical protein [Gilvimarinus xylanilyticus]
MKKLANGKQPGRWTLDAGRWTLDAGRLMSFAGALNIGKQTPG